MSNSETAEPHIFKGLAGVPVDVTAISMVNSDTNSLLYRGYPVQQLAARCSVEQVALLLWDGELPSAERLTAFQVEERSNRALADSVRRAIDDLPVTTHPMDVCRTAVSIIGANDPDAESNDPQHNNRKARHLFAQLPAIVAYDQRRRHGLPLVEPRSDLNYTENFLYMTLGELPVPEVVDAFRISLVLYAEHSFNASTFTARVITSTLSDMYSAVTGAIGALKGALHGGANEAVMYTFDEIGTPDRVDAWLDDALAHKRKIMGFGHRVYKNGDSRVPTMRAAMVSMLERFHRPDLLEISTRLEAGMKERTGILPNVDYPTGPAYHVMGFDTATFTPIFVTARVIGWTAHIMEQTASNALIRPLSVYVGAPEREVPLSAEVSQVTKVTKVTE
ncbi:bifunctional 2-methylcitrate synthase/citrate synthase [Cryobacterium sp. CG_9.6]|uniref:bifunctional 2-methylcitrate synthase/citrate synthase n=1 Tax=Cryobacterium sp. CG_9.6 TaxID=2760710 RepID=UPI002474D81F|nr:bifunctional 2-methylcitrate synthase/citrate synthase [Cryobacterium sp. CG_9.6]MDH6235545.1 citrate synthase/2-methylcitrate synthase [Cryobacterium sp. CG_9.6]